MEEELLHEAKSWYQMYGRLLLECLDKFFGGFCRAKFYIPVFSESSVAAAEW